ncbi:MAG: hypothetical protein HYU36_15530 [Planctomycetes bacterium]|nr:hypothetical protein [Planctomycetota bacterium]
MLFGLVLAFEAAAKDPILAPKVKQGHVLAGPASYDVDRTADSPRNGGEESAEEAQETLQGTVIGSQKEFIRVRRDRGADIHLSLHSSCRTLRDEVVAISALTPGETLAIAGEVRGFAAGLPPGEPPRRILGARFIFKTESAPPKGEEKSDEEDGDRTPSLLPRGNLHCGRLLSTQPLLIENAEGGRSEIRPATNCRVIQVQAADLRSVVKGSAVRAEGLREKATLRPKGKTLTRYVFQARQLRILSPDLSESEYRQILGFDW